MAEVDGGKVALVWSSTERIDPWHERVLSRCVFRRWFGNTAGGLTKREQTYDTLSGARADGCSQSGKAPAVSRFTVLAVQSIMINEREKSNKLVALTGIFVELNDRSYLFIAHPLAWKQFGRFTISYVVNRVIRHDILFARVEMIE